MVSAHLKPFLLFQGASESAAVLAISLFAIGNTTGRLLWGIIHDKIGSRRSVLFSLGCLVAALGFLAILATQPTTLLISPLIILIGFGFGGCFVIYVSAITNVFGVNQMPKLYPICFVGYGVAALISPAAGGWLIDRFDSYTQAFSLSAVLITLAILFAWMIDRRQWTRPEVVKALAEAAAEGDRSENAEYTYRKKQLGGIDRRVRDISKRLDHIQVVDRPPAQTDKVRFGAWVELSLGNGERRRYRIVGADETDARNGWVSVDSPVARALLGKEVGEEFQVRLPEGEQWFEVLAVSYESPG